MNGLWQRAAGRLRTELGEVGYETWIGPLNFLGLHGKTATIAAPNRFFRDWVHERYLGLLRQSLSAEAGENLDVKLTLGERLREAAERSVPRQAPAPPAPTGEPGRRDRHPQLNPRHTFQEFIIGSSNQFAHAAALAVANQPGDKYNPLFIYGGVGLGKTHLVTAIGHHLWTTGKRKVLFMPAEVFMNELITS